MQWEKLRKLCWAGSTWTAYESRWNCYIRFCNEFNCNPLPASVQTVCLYITYLSKKCVYNTITAYVSSIWALHNQLGYEHFNTNNFLFKSTMMGAKRLLGKISTQKDPIMPADLIKIRSVLDVNKPLEAMFWIALTVCYRLVLRVGHVTRSTHCLRVKDILFWEGGMDVVIRSSKTIQYNERVNTVPVVASPGSPICPVQLLKDYVCGKSPEEELFPISYGVYSALLKRCCNRAGLQGNYGTHSIRRGSANYLATFLPAHQVKQYGDWRSWCVLLYLADSYKTRREKDLVVSKQYAQVGKV